ncbi:hypothetical protein LUZ60_016723 [Juncus effusus]|nr:hypothetical protein LUZ60_016723 [Juncus effusus]
MERANENLHAVPKPLNFRATSTRRALAEIKVPIPPSNPITKKQLSEKNAAVSHRPITRRYAASLQANRGQFSNLPLKVPKIKDPVYISDSESTTPMIEEEVEEMDIKLGETNEVEMEDILDESDLDIDSADLKDPLSVSEYVVEIHNNYRKIEEISSVNPDYMLNQPDVNERMRAILIDWLIEVHYRFELMEETLFLTVNIIDRFLEREKVARKKLQLVGVTALLLACKYEEVSVPVVEDLVLISDRAYSREEILEMEWIMAKTLQFDMSVPTPYLFMKRFLKAAQSDRQTELLSLFLVELVLLEYKMLKYKPSLLAAASVYTAQCSLNHFKSWTRSSQVHSGYSEDQLFECARLMVDLHQKAGSGKHTSVHRKYSTYKFGCAAKSEPALVLLD